MSKTTMSTILPAWPAWCTVPAGHLPEPDASQSGRARIHEGVVASHTTLIGEVVQVRIDQTEDHGALDQPGFPWTGLSTSSPPTIWLSSA